MIFQINFKSGKPVYLQLVDQIKAAAPARAYETQYGRDPGSTNTFVESVYKSLTGKK